MDGADVELETPHVYVCGLLAAGTVKTPYESSLRITLAAGDEAVALDEDGIDYGTEAFAVFGGLVFLRGAACPDPRSYASRDAVAQGLVPRTTWTRLSSHFGRRQSFPQTWLCTGRTFSRSSKTKTGMSQGLRKQ